jgi:DNA-binding beta-propeller fold protein YncE
MPSDVQIAGNGDIYIADMHHNRVRKVDGVTHIISTVAGNGMFGATGDNGPAVNASLAGPAGLALVEDTLGRLTIFIADYYNGTVRAVDFNGVLRNVSDEGRVKFGAPSRVAFAPGTGWLYVADSSNHQVVALNVPVGLLSLGPRGLGARGLVPAASRGSNRRAS